MRLRNLPVPLFAVITALAVVACGGSARTNLAKEDVGTSSPNSTSAAALLRELTDWPGELAPAQDALPVLTGRCMGRLGLRYIVVPPAATPKTSPLVWLGPQSMASRLTDGWGLYQETLAQAKLPGGVNGSNDSPANAQNTYEGSLRGAMAARYSLALNGDSRKRLAVKQLGAAVVSVPRSGCISAAESELFGSVQASVQVGGLGDLEIAVLMPLVRQDGEYRSGMKRWAACVARAGVHIGAIDGTHTDTPQDLYDQMTDLYDSKGPTPRLKHTEVAAAVADLKCQRATSLANVANTAELRAVRKLSNQTVGQVEAVVEILHRANARAEHVLASSGRAS